MKKYSPHIQKQIDAAGGYDSYRERMKLVRQGLRPVTEDKVDEIELLYGRGMTQDQISVQTGISQATISNILKRRRDEADN